MHINLLPPHVQSRIRARALLRRCCVLWLVAGVGTFACSSAQLWELRAAQARLQRLSVPCQPLRLLENAIESEQERLTQLQAETRRLENLQPNNRHVAALGILIRAAQPEQGKLQVQKLSWHAGTPAVTRPCFGRHCPHADRNTGDFRNAQLQPASARSRRR